jgi:hypothetical protein
MESSLKIRSITVTSYKVLPEQQGGYVKLYVQVQGRTRFIHPISLQSDSSPSFRFSTRYSELLCMHLELKELFPSLELPIFPKKKWLGSRSQSFISKRIQQLNDYFAQILATNELNPSEPLMRLISPHRASNILVVGGPRVGKQYLVELFLASESSNHPGRAQNKNSMCSQEIVKMMPVDLLVDHKLYRIASVDIRTFNGVEGQEKAFLQDALGDKHGVVFMYKERGNSGHGIASRMYELLKGKFPCVLANCDENSYINEVSIRSSQDAFAAFEGLIRIFKAD